LLGLITSIEDQWLLCVGKMSYVPLHVANNITSLLSEQHIRELQYHRPLIHVCARRIKLRNTKLLFSQVRSITNPSRHSVIECRVFVARTHRNRDVLMTLTFDFLAVEVLPSWKLVETAVVTDVHCVFISRSKPVYKHFQRFFINDKR